MLKFIKKYIKELKKKRKILKRLQVGDLVWAKMPLKNKELKEIPESHRVRPYLIVHKNFWNIYAYQTSSKKSKNLNNYEVYGISKLRYKKSRNTWIMLNKLSRLPFYNLKSKFSSLNLTDLKAIEKRLQVQINRRKEVKFTFKEEIDISEGDVIRINHPTYYIYSCDNVYLYGYRIFKKNPHTQKNEVLINRKKYYIDINDKVTIKRDTEMQITDIASFDEINAIKNLKSSLKNKKKEVKKSEVKINHEIGTVFQVGNDKIVYLFEAEGVYYGVDLIMYQMFPKVIPIHGIAERQIVDKYDKNKCKKILETLLLNNAKPLKTIRNLYEEIEA